MVPHVPRLILDLATVLGVAAVITLVFRRLSQPAVLGYMLAGMIVGPHVPIPLVADVENVQTLAELGVVLLMFSVGLEFDVRKVLEKGPAAILLGAVQLGCTTWLGFMAGRALGWTLLQCAFMGAALAISSTMIIAKLFEEHRARGHLRDRVLSVLVVQDLFAILLLAGLGATAVAGAFGAQGLGRTLGRVALLLAGLLGVGGLVVPRLLRWAADRGRDETLLVAAVGVCFTCGGAGGQGRLLPGPGRLPGGRCWPPPAAACPGSSTWCCPCATSSGHLLRGGGHAAGAPVAGRPGRADPGPHRRGPGWATPWAPTLGGALAGLPLRTGLPHRPGPGPARGVLLRAGGRRGPRRVPAARTSWRCRWGCAWSRPCWAPPCSGRGDALAAGAGTPAARAGSTGT